MWKNYAPVWTIITLTLLLFVAISYCQDTSSDNNRVIKTATFRDYIAKKAQKVTNVDSNAVSDTATDVRVAVKTGIPAPTDTASQNILIIGDSMLEGLNPRLAAYAKANGHKLNSVIWYSSSTEYWGTCDTLKVFLKRFNPSFIFISLGGNELFVRNIKEKREGYLRNFLKQIGDIPYLWIGPPNWKADTGINDLIKENVPEGCFFLSNGMHFERQKDGAHPTHKSAALWLDSVARWMPDHAAHPIRFNRPADSIKARPAHVVVLQPKK